MDLYDFSIIYTYRNGSQYTEHFAKPQTLAQLREKAVAARKRYDQESNIAKIQYKATLVESGE